MPLDNTAKLSDIISALQTMEGINAKADLASVVGSPATANDTMAAINAVIQNAKDAIATAIDVPNTTPLQVMADNIAAGIEATGSIPAPASDTITISGLNFKPSKIILRADNEKVMGTYVEGRINNYIIAQVTSAPTLIAATWTVNNTGFTCKGSSYQWAITSSTIVWHAIK